LQWLLWAQTSRERDADPAGLLEGNTICQGSFGLVQATAAIATDPSLPRSGRTRRTRKQRLQLCLPAAWQVNHRALAAVEAVFAARRRLIDRDPGFRTKNFGDGEDLAFRVP